MLSRWHRVGVPVRSSRSRSAAMLPVPVYSRSRQRPRGRFRVRAALEPTGIPVDGTQRTSAQVRAEARRSPQKAISASLV